MTIPTLLAAGSALMWGAAFAGNSTSSITAAALRALNPNNNSSLYGINECVIGSAPCLWDGVLGITALFMCGLTIGVLDALEERQLIQRITHIPQHQLPRLNTHILPPHGARAPALSLVWPNRDRKGACRPHIL